MQLLRSRAAPDLAALALAAIIALSAAACGQPSTSPAHEGGTSPATARPAPGSTRAPAASAAAQLAAFEAAAQRADSQLGKAAAMVNGDIGATSMRFTPATLAALRALTNEPAARAIPAGLPGPLLRAVLVVYGDLASRTAAFGGIEMYGSTGSALPIGGPGASAVLRGLRNGAAAAARFSADLAAVRALALRTPPVATSAQGSRAAAELAVRLRSIDHRNGCDETFGGWVPLRLETIIWQPGASQGRGRYEGTISGIRFQATYTAQHAWDIVIYAC